MTAKKYLWILCTLLPFVGCSDLEDTYEDYAGDGQIRYLTQCSDVVIVPGWQKLNMTWKNSPDPVVDSIRITWSAEGQSGRVALPADTEAYTIDNLTEEGTYEVNICGVDNEGNTSLAITSYARPYSENHELVVNFPQLIVKQFFVKNNVILYFADWSADMETAVLHYTKAGNAGAGELPLDSAFVTDNRYYMLESIDPTKPVTLERTGRLSGEVVPLSTLTLGTTPFFSADFRNLFKTQFGVENLTEAELAKIEVLDIDYTMSSLEDVLYFPNLKVLNLGKNRYLHPNKLTQTNMALKQYPGIRNDSSSYLTDAKERSEFALEKAHEILGLQVNRYNQHFLPNVTADYLTAKGNPVPEELDFYSSADWEYTWTPEDEEGDPQLLDKLFDGDNATIWEPIKQPSWREHTITVSMGEKQEVHGICVTQRDFGTDGYTIPKYAPSMVKIQVSENGVDWTNATFVEENTLGTTSAEKTIIRFAETKHTAFVRFIFNDQVANNNFGIAVADIEIF